MTHNGFSIEIYAGPHDYWFRPLVPAWEWCSSVSFDSREEAEQAGRDAVDRLCAGELEAAREYAVKESDVQEALAELRAEELAEPVWTPTFSAN